MEARSSLNSWIYNNIFMLVLNHSITLTSNGTCTLLGMTSGLVIHVEQVPADEDETIIHNTLNIHGRYVTDAPPLDDILQPLHGTVTSFLNFNGARLRGHRATERVNDVVRHIPVVLKQQLIDHLGLDVTPGALLGMAESYVLSEARLPDDQYIVCRRLRFIHALTAPPPDYDYDSIIVQVAHSIDPKHDDEIALKAALDELPGDLYQPTDCLFHAGYLVMTDSGGTDEFNHLHIYQYSPPDGKIDVR